MNMRMEIYRRIRAEAPRASIAYAMIVEVLMRRRSVYQKDICIEVADNVNSTLVPQALQQLENMGIVQIDRGLRSQGNEVSLVWGRQVKPPM